MINAVTNAQSGFVRERGWGNSRLVVHIAGTEAGHLQLDLDLPEFETTDEVCGSVKLVIPGEISPLNAISADGQRGHFAVSFYSSDIANGGHLPAEAVVCWETRTRENRMLSVDVVSAAEAKKPEASAAPQNFAAVRYGGYPMTVVLVAFGALALALLGTAAVLLQN